MVCQSVSEKMWPLLLCAIHRSATSVPDRAREKKFWMYSHGLSALSTTSQSFLSPCSTNDASVSVAVSHDVHSRYRTLSTSYDSKSRSAVLSVSITYNLPALRAAISHQ